jgi:hypothetical protein
VVDNACELESDLVVEAEGVSSKLRTRHAAALGPTFTPGHNRCAMTSGLTPCRLAAPS